MSSTKVAGSGTVAFGLAPAPLPGWPKLLCQSWISSRYAIHLAPKDYVGGIDGAVVVEIARQADNNH